jgi:hypothetical protein
VHAALVEHSDVRVGPTNIDFDFLEYFRTDHRFATLFADYQYLTEIGPLRVFKRDVTSAAEYTRR